MFKCLTVSCCQNQILNFSLYNPILSSFNKNLNYIIENSIYLLFTLWLFLLLIYITYVTMDLRSNYEKKKLTALTNDDENKRKN